MSYTPTTEHIIAAYEGQLVKIGENRYEFIDENEAKVEFNRWLSKLIADEHDKVFSILQEFTDPLGFVDIPTIELKEIIRERLSQ